MFKANQKGYIALFSVIILSVFVGAVIMGITMRSVESFKMSNNRQNAAKSHAIAEACAEYVISELDGSLNYDAQDTIIIDGNSCEIVSVNGSSQSVVIETKSDFKGFTKKIQAEVSKSDSELKIQSWQEVSEF